MKHKHELELHELHRVKLEVTSFKLKAHQRDFEGNIHFQTGTSDKVEQSFFVPKQALDYLSISEYLEKSLSSLKNCK